MIGTARTAPITLDAFLAWEERQVERWERVGGVARTRSGGTIAHDTIANYIRAALQRALRGTPCSRHGPDVKVISPAGDVMYPDAFVRCGRIDPAATRVDDPVVVFEVLSEGTALHDLTRKRLAYKTIPSLRLIVYVAQDRPRLDLVRRDPTGRWDDDAPVTGLDGTLELPEIAARLAMAEIYEGVEVAGEDTFAGERA
jgi:Uma2 family endonuclease